MQCVDMLSQLRQTERTLVALALIERDCSGIFAYFLYMSGSGSVREQVRRCEERRLSVSPLMKDQSHQRSPLSTP